MMYFRYKIKKDLFGTAYTLIIQCKSSTDDKWKRFKRTDLFKLCADFEGEWWVFSCPGYEVQRNIIINCINKYGSVEKLVTKYILSILKERASKMVKRNDSQDTKKLLNNIANNTWSNVITIDEETILEGVKND